MCHSFIHSSAGDVLNIQYVVVVLYAACVYPAEYCVPPVDWLSVCYGNVDYRVPFYCAVLLMNNHVCSYFV